MSNANRIPLRRDWKNDHPAQFGRTTKQLVAGVKIAPRVTFGLYKIQKLFPTLYAAMSKLALKQAGAKTDTAGETIVDSPDKVTGITASMNRLAHRFRGVAQ